MSETKINTTTQQFPQISSWSSPLSMLRKMLLPTILALLAYGFWISPDFMEIAAGVAIFLFGMVSLEEGFRIFSGGFLERLLKRCTDRLYKSLSFGIVSTTLMQSSSLVSVITISFLSTGMIGLHAGLGIIFGANLGTTTGAWLVAGFGLKVKISAYALPFLVFGVIMIFQRAKPLKGIGYILVGLGLLFLGIHFMKEGFEAVKDTINLEAYAVPGYRGLFIFLGIGVIATVVMQSSHATLVLIITALASQQITYENALALAIGANIGTTITAIIGAMSANVQGKRLAGGHLVFNVTTGLIAVIMIHPFALAVDSVSNLVGIAAGDHSLRLAVFHTLFNLVGVLVMAPWLGGLVRLMKWVMPEKVQELTRPRYLNEAAIAFYDTALEAVRNETDHLYENAFVLLAHGIDLHRGEILSGRDMNEVVESQRDPIVIEFDEDYTQTVKVIYSAIVEFATRAQTQLTPEQGEQIHRYRLASRHIVEAVKSVKHLRKNLSVRIHDGNPHIQKAYNDIRGSLGNVMRELAAFRQAVANGEEIELAMLDDLRLDVKQADVLASGTLDELIRDDLISAKVATSLMNDSSYTFYTVNHLVAMAECLYVCKGDCEAQPDEEQEAGGDEPGDEAALPEIEPARPRYIDEVSLSSTCDVITATRLETENLYDHALDVITRAIGFSDDEVRSEQDLTDIVEARLLPAKIGFDEHYEKTVKVLYAAITRFVSKARTEIPLGKRAQLLALRGAALSVAEAVKCVKHLRKNLSVYVASDNDYIRRAYNDIRIMLGNVMRGLVAVRSAAEEGDAGGTSTEGLNEMVAEADILADGSLDVLVRDDLITPWMATSLMNDSAYARHAARHLLDMARCVFIPEPVNGAAPQ